MSNTHGQGDQPAAGGPAREGSAAPPGDGPDLSDVDGLGFDRVLERLRRVVERLETGNLSLEDSLRVYEEGVALARRGHGLLDSAEKRVEMLVRGPRGQTSVAPLEPAGGDGDP